MISLKSLPFLFKNSIPRSITSLKRGHFTNLCARYSFWSQPWNHLETYRHEKRLILTSMRLLLICGFALRYGYKICFPSKKFLHVYQLLCRSCLQPLTHPSWVLLEPKCFMILLLVPPLKLISISARSSLRVLGVLILDLSFCFSVSSSSFS